MPRAKSQEPRAKSQSNALKILICYYDSYGLPPLDNGILFPIQAGKSISDRDLHIQGDNELNGQPCDNISEKNPTYSELTALYWAWKNLKKIYPDVKYVGWTHYRRFFAFDEKKYFACGIPKSPEEIKTYKVNPDKIINILESGKIILTKISAGIMPLYMQYSNGHFSEDYRTLKRVIREKFPDYYEEFINFMEHNNKISWFCMFVMKYDDFVKCCEWIFAVLAEVEPLIPFQCYSSYQKRVLAFMAERLLNVYIRKNKLKTEELNIYFYGNHHAPKNIFIKFLAYFRRALKYLMREITFKLVHALQEKPKS